MVWVRALSVGLGCISLLAFISGGGKCQTKTIGRESTRIVLISPTLCSSSHALSIVSSTRCTPQVTAPRPCSSAPTVTLSPA